MSKLDKEKSLKKHKAIATGLFVAMVILYGLMVYLNTKQNYAWIGYVKSFAEAAMVGALADWFAVTALFKYPLGLKIPHTNLIENSKNKIGENLSTFVTENFLNPLTIRPYIEKLNTTEIAANWLNKESNQIFLQQEVNLILLKILNDLEDQEVVDFMSLKAEEILNEIDYTKLSTSIIDYVVENNKYNDVLDYLLPKAKVYIAESDLLIKDKLNKKHPIISFFAGKRISREVVEGVVSFITEIEDDVEHPIRNNIKSALLKAKDKLQYDDAWKDKLIAYKDDLITRERLNIYITEIWNSLKNNLSESLQQKDSFIQLYIIKNIKNLADNLTNNESLKLKINNWVRYFVYKTALRNVKNIETLISNTVSNWEGKELSDKLELEVGKDLQFIRVNGTIVGGLVGLLIYAITQFFLH